MIFRALILIALFPISAYALRFDFRDALQRNTVHFISDGLIERTVGLTTALTGWVELDPDKPGEAIAGEWEVDTRMFQTGFEGRNEVIREKFFRAFDFPSASFRPTRWLTPPKRLADGKTQTGRLEGELILRGVKKQVPVEVKLTFFKPSEVTAGRLGGQLLKVNAEFNVGTEDFALQIPETFKGRYAKSVQVQVDAVGTDRPPQAGGPALEATKPK